LLPETLIKEGLLAVGSIFFAGADIRVIKVGKVIYEQ